MVVRKYTRTRIQKGGTGVMPPHGKPQSMFKEAKKSKQYTFGQRIWSTPGAIVSRGVGAYQGLSTAVVGTTKRGSEWLTRRTLLASARRTQKKAEQALNIVEGRRGTGFLWKSKPVMNSHTKYTKIESDLATLREQTQKSDKDIKRIAHLESQILRKQQDNQDYKSLNDQIYKKTENGKFVLKTKETIEAKLKEKSKAQQDALDKAKTKVEERQLLLAKSGEEFKRLGSNIKKSYKQGKTDYYNARRAYGEFYDKHKKIGFISAPVAFGAYLAYKLVARPLVDVGTELLDTQAGRAISRKVAAKQLSSDSVSLGQTIISHQEKTVELGENIDKLKLNIKTSLASLASLPDDSSLKTSTSELSTQLETIDKSRVNINILRQKFAKSVDPGERNKLKELITKEADNIKSGKVILAKLRQSILNEKSESPENVDKIISNFDSAYALLTQRNKYLDMGYDAERAIVSKAEKGKKFLEETEAGTEIKQDIQNKLKTINKDLQFQKTITDDDFSKISNAFEQVKQNMRISGSIGVAKKNWGNTYRYLDALLSNYGSNTLVPNAPPLSNSVYNTVEPRL